MPTVGLIQMHCAEDVEENLERADMFIRKAAKDGAEIVMLPEIFYSRFFPARIDPIFMDQAISVEDDRVQRFVKLAASLDIVLILPIYERVYEGVFYNTTLTIDGFRGIVGRYRKTHIPLNPHFFEKFYFKPGNLGYPVVHTQYGRIGTPICHDRHYPEVARAFALAGAQILVYPTAAYYPGLAQSVWEIELQALAIANQLFVTGINRVGTEESLTYFGRSVVIDPSGTILAQCGAEEEILLVSLDLLQVEEHRRMWHFFRDRRPDTYHILTNTTGVEQ